MKRTSIATFLLACMLFTGCSESDESSVPPSESSIEPEASEVFAENSIEAESSFEEPSEDNSSYIVSVEESSEEPLQSEEESSEEPVSVEESSEEPSEEPSGPVYEDINFAKWQKINKDIYAWIRIPGTVIDYPILNRPGDNGYYLKRNYYCYADTRGSIFTEDYNSRDFNDPVTLIYGHNMSSGQMFGSIQKTYTKKSFMESHKELQIILPDKTYTYEIFAAVPYTNVHLMYYYDFRDAHVFTEVFKDILSVRAMNAVIDRTVKVTPSDHVVILSTCLSGNDAARYLLLAVRKD